MEPRRVLSADPVIAGVTYLEGDEGQDTTPDYFEVTFQGGAETTEMTQFVISGDQDSSGTLNDGDMFFDVNDSLPGVGGHHDFQFHAGGSSGISASDILGVSVSDDGLTLIVDVQNFEAGDILAFTIDVDEMEKFKVDKIASGVEFEGSMFNAQFVDQHYTFSDLSVGVNATIEGGFVQPQQEGIFYDSYDQLLAEGENVASNTLIDLVRDNEEGFGDRTAAAIDAYELTPKPISISGQVYHDENLNCERDANEDGIADVVISLQKMNETTGQYETVATTTTDANGNYEFGEDLGLMPGDYRLVEAQPDGYLDVGADVGTMGGEKHESQNGDLNIITGINVPLGGTSADNYDFKEVKPASLSGNVWHDRDDDGVMDPNEEGIANVLIKITRVGAKDGVTDDPFADTDTIFVRTDANGHYSVDALPPGIYEVMEVNNYPNAVDPLASYIDGKDSIGNINGVQTGTKTNDMLSQIELCAGDDSVENNFGELKPASISGYVSVEGPDGSKLDPNDPNFEAIGGVTLQLFDFNGDLVAQTQTDANGFYEFDDLTPGTYSVVEVQPNGFLDGGESIGNVNGQLNPNTVVSNDRFDNIVVGSDQAGVRYDFCEKIPAELCGTVYHDRNDNGIQDAGEEGIGGVTIQLFNADGNLVAVTQTNAQGDYCFSNLEAGEYKIREIQPTAFADGKDQIGDVISANGSTQQSGHLEGNDVFCEVMLVGGDEGVNYDFGELRLASISGNVYADADGIKNGFDPSGGDIALEGVVMILLDANGNEVERTSTDSNGDYAFEGLRPGTYSVQQIGPDGYIDSGEAAGTVDGVSVGQVADDLLSGIVLTSGSEGVNYDFCEIIPAELCGTVYHDRNDNGKQDAGEEGISGTRVVLYDENGNIVAESLTDANGDYCFKDLLPGSYCITETQPTGFVDGKDSIGQIGGNDRGTSQDNQHCVTITGGEKGVNYDFGELKLSMISGFVHVDNNGDCVFDQNAGEEPIANVTMELLDANGNVVATTTTDANGMYKFNDVLPGEYSIRQTQPGAFFTGGERVGSGDGTASQNTISGISIGSDQNLTQYNFCEVEAAEIHGRVWEDGPAFETFDGQVPDDYRTQRDGIYQEGVDTPLEGVRMMLYYYIDPTAGEIAPRPVTLGEVMGEHYSHMGTSDPNAPVWVETMANGEYWFMGLQGGSYIVVESQPEGYVDSNDTAGTTTGFTSNTLNAAQTQAPILRMFGTEQIMDTVVNIQVANGGISEANNFSEVRALQTDVPNNPLPPTPVDPTPSSNPITPRPGLTGLPGLAGAQSTGSTQFIGTSRGAAFQVQGTQQDVEPYTWHLSVVNGGTPRNAGEGVDQSDSIWQQASFINSTDWSRFDMDDAVWTFTQSRGDNDLSVTDNTIRFGMLGGTPLAGDFDGDGTDEVAVFKDGYWMIDLNRNGRWDESDLLAKLGDEDDRPVVGDWDGDGKDDIGIYGPIWAKDLEAIERDPGLPNPDNDPYTKPKNVPPTDGTATNGARTMKLTSYGRQRADVVDHVFGTGEREDVPVTGDWNGNGIRSIGIFNDGIWKLDVNGDGKFDHEDTTAHFGRAGDIPVVGDFNGDGIEEIAVYRSGTWLIDTNGNRELDAADKTFELGGAADKPVVGDWNGDGTDEPGLYSEQSTNSF